MAKPPKRPSAEMPFLDHLEELRWRIIWSLAGIAAGMVVGLVITFTSDWLINFLIAPATRYVGPLKFTNLMEGFTIRLNTAFAIGVVLSLPNTLYQLWAFLAPGLYKTERRVTLAVIVSGVVLFVSGATMAYTIVVPLAVKWLAKLGTSQLQPMITLDGFIGLPIGLMLVFGIGFQLPLVILALSAVGLVDAKFLSKYRRHAILIIVFLSEILTPGDLIFTTLSLAIPVYVLFEISVVLTRMNDKRRERKLAEEAASTD
jgi:sec-independent protein translocase protein TatC